MQDDSTPTPIRRRKPIPPKLCTFCGGIMYIHDTENSYDFSNRKTCSQECRNKSVRKNISITRAKQKPCIPSKPCVICGSLIVAKPNEPNSKFTKKNTCSRPCTYKLISTTRTLDRDATRRCVICGDTFSYRPNEDKSRFEKRMTCSQKCWRELGGLRSVRPVGPKPCVVCGEAMSRKKSDTRSQFKDRKTCSSNCRRILVSRSKTIGSERVLDGPYPLEWTSSLKSAIRDRDGNCCSICGSSKSARELHVHHINYQKHDCRPDNLITLCSSCHGKTNHGERSDWYFKCRAILVERGIVDLDDIAA